ncbi:alpha/beta fold hydrolase [Thermaurantiacus sp.]
MRKRYLDLAPGQLHLRDSDGEGPVLLLLHMTPLSGAMFAQLGPAFPGVRLLAPDLYGYGGSDPRGEPWTVADWADPLAAMLDELGVEAAAVYGAHVGAAVALELGARHPARVGRLMLDGLPFPTPELRAAFAAIGRAPAPSTLGEVVARVEGLLREYGAGDPFAALKAMLETGFISSAPVMAGWEPAPLLAQVGMPLLVLGAEADSQAASFMATLALRPDAARHCWPGTHPLHDPARAGEFATPIRAFLGYLAGPTAR